MFRPQLLRAATLALALTALATAAQAQGEAEKYSNLKVLPKDISPAELLGLMNSFTRALGVRCIYCHVSQEGKPFRHEDFALDDKMTKLKARAMLTMVHDLNENYLAKLDGRSQPPVKVECFTCHHGGQLPRTLQDALLITYDEAGIDSTLQHYQTLRTRYYGRAVYDFGEVALADLGTRLQGEGHEDDALRVEELNVQQNPASAFARRQHAAVAIGVAFVKGPPQGAQAYHDLKDRYGDKVVNEDMLNGVGYQLLGGGKAEAAIAALKLIADENPTSANAFDSLGEAYAAHGDRKLAVAAYKKSLALDPKNDNAKAKLAELARMKDRPKR
jgi:tetratricopeptide (TPR) repeat protein